MRSTENQPAPTGRTALKVIGFIILIPMMFLFMGGVIIVALGQLTDDETTTIEVAQGTFATTAGAVVIIDVTDPGTYGSGASRLIRSDPSDIMVEIRGEGTNQFFVGIGSAEEVADYLETVATSTITGFRDGTTLLDTPTIASTEQPGPPAEQQFWVASAVGGGQKQIEWIPEDGSWSLVVMNADARPGVAGTMTIDTDSAALTAVGPPLTIVGAIGTLTAALILRRSKRR